jgi:hypothetical protein
LEQAVAQGHRFWILAEAIPEEEQVIMSEYRNAEQNTAQVGSRWK